MECFRKLNLPRGATELESRLIPTTPESHYPVPIARFLFGACAIWHNISFRFRQIDLQWEPRQQLRDLCPSALHWMMINRAYCDAILSMIGCPLTFPPPFLALFLTPFLHQRCHKTSSITRSFITMIVNGEKFACDACIRGHRVAQCQHTGES